MPKGCSCISRTLLCHGIIAGQQQEVLQGKLPFPTLKINLYLSLMQLGMDLQGDIPRAPEWLL